MLVPCHCLLDVAPLRAVILPLRHYVTVTMSPRHYVTSPRAASMSRMLLPVLMCCQCASCVPISLSVVSLLQHTRVTTPLPLDLLLLLSRALEVLATSVRTFRWTCPHKFLHSAESAALELQHKVSENLTSSLRAHSWLQ